MAAEAPTPSEAVLTSRKVGALGSNTGPGSQGYRAADKGGNKAHKNQLLMLLLQMMMEEKEDAEDKATQTYQKELAGDKESSLTPALANNPATALMGPQKPKEEPKDDFKNMLLALLLKSQG
jgi:hypothetical protein